MNNNTIPLDNFLEYDSLLPFIESFKNFNIDTAIEELKKDLVKDTISEEEQYWFHIYNIDGVVRYDSNVDCAADINEQSTLPTTGEWKYIKFQDTTIRISNKVKELFKQHLDILNNTSLQVEVHSISMNAKIPDHVDIAGLGINEGLTRNLLVHLNYPKGQSINEVGMHIEGKTFSPEVTPVILFDSQRYHGAWNRTDDDWTMLLIYVPAEQVTGETIVRS